MMPLLTLVLFAVGLGIFATLSASERRVWPLMWHGSVAESDIRLVQRLLTLLVDVLPPVMMVIVFGSGVLIVWQAITGQLGDWLWSIAATYAVMLVVILRTLFPTIRAIKGLDMTEGPTDRVRPVIRASILVHHQGFALALAMVPMFLAVVAST